MKEYDLLLAELIIKVAAMENLLANKGIISSEALTEEMKKLSEEVVKRISSFPTDKERN